jgi:hypothetical protein
MDMASPETELVKRFPLLTAMADQNGTPLEKEANALLVRVLGQEELLKEAQRLLHARVVP